MNRIVINMDAQGGFTVYSDEPIELFCVSDHTPNDRVYQMEPEVGVDLVRQQLGNDPVGHKNDSHLLGSGYGQRKPPSKRKFQVITPASPAQTDTRHEFVPNKKYPWFCAHCGYAPHEPLKHIQPDSTRSSNRGDHA